MIENQQYDKKSLMIITKRNPDWKELAKDCVCFDNANGGKIWIGINDDKDLPVENQKIDFQLLHIILRQILNRTINVSINTTVQRACQWWRIHRDISAKVSNSNCIYH